MNFWTIFWMVLAILFLVANLAIIFVRDPSLTFNAIAVGVLSISLYKAVETLRDR